jgi:hypothetical protein
MTILGAPFSYGSIWQRRQLVLITAGGVDEHSARRHALELKSRAAEFDSCDTEVIVTRDPVPGIPEHATVVADRWGAIIYIEDRSDVTALPDVQDLLDQAAYVQSRCPECEGEAR